MSSALHEDAETAFGSQCDGVRLDGRIYLGPGGDPYDFSGSFGTTFYTAVMSTTWGKIKERYR